ncbi:CPBP family intramembrane glutamic endopeptidase [Salegentibacter mishustinae]|uniref:CPBP family intramembrane glutamic endopeptidase n=1 Tax=Salegentibacter mishustinae TaxID=270918 RepID=UPI003CD0C542
MLKKNLKELIDFILNPTTNTPSSANIKSKLLDVLRLYLLKLLITTFLILLNELLIDIENTGLKNLTTPNSVVYIIILGGFLSPLVEEIMFRLSIYFKPIYLGITSLFCSLTILSNFAFDVGILKLDGTFFYRYIISIAIGIFIYYFSKRYFFRIRIFWNTNFKRIYFASAILFGLFHFSNFKVDNPFLIPILTLPNIIAGLFFGYVRIKYGFVYTVFFHVINNLISLSIALVLR